MRAWLYVLTLSLAACAPGARPTGAPTEPAARASVSVDEAWSRLCEGPDSVPMEAAGSREFVTLTLPGASRPEPLRFHVDTGGNTPGLMLLGSEAARLGFASADTLPRALHIAGRDLPVPNGARWILLDADGPQARFEDAIRRDYAVGQLGAGFLSRFVVCIDPAAGRIGFGDPRAYDVEAGEAAWAPLYMLPNGPNRALYPFVRAAVGGGAYGLLLDTGATTSMLDHDKLEALAKGHPGWPAALGAFGDADMIGGAWDETVLRADGVAIGAPRAIDLGPATFVDRPAGTWSRMFGDVAQTHGSHGALANDVLLRFRLLIDYPHARLFLRPSGVKPESSASSSRVGVSLVFDDPRGCPRISQVTDTNAPATRDALRVGDVLLSVDGHDACRLWHHQIASLLAGPPGTLRHLVLQRGARVHDADVPTAELLPSRQTR